MLHFLIGHDYGWWRKPYPNVPEMEITNGTTITDGEGKFKIDFIAIPDLNLNKNGGHSFLILYMQIL